MGRGRAKAKQTKVARELKYSGGGVDLDRLREELVGKPAVRSTDDPDDDLDDEYATYTYEDDEEAR